MPYWSLENVPWTNMHDLNLDWIINTMKETVNQWITYQQEMNDNYTEFTGNIEEWKAEIEEDFADLQTYVQTYFDNLDLTAATRTVINDMISSGEFIQVLNPSIVSATESWLASHITPTTPAIDSSLSISGAAADAKATGDAIASTETYAENGLGLSDCSFNTGWIDVSGTTVDVTDIHSDPIYRYAIVSCSPGDQLLVNVYGTNAARGWCFIDSAGAVVTRGSTSSYGVYHQIVTCPPNANRAIIQNRVSSLATYYCYKLLAYGAYPKSTMFKGNLRTLDYTNISDAVNPGVYYISNSQTFTDRPVSASTSVGAVLDVKTVAATLTLQTYYGGDGIIQYRFITTGTHAPFTDGLTADSNGWWMDKNVQNVSDNGFIFRGQPASADYDTLLAKIVQPGSYYINNGQPFTDRPINIQPTLSATMSVTLYAATLVLQTYVTARGDVLYRIVNNSTFDPYVTGINADSNGWWSARQAVHSRWANKTIVFFGDSRTWYDGKAYTERTKPEWEGRTCVGYQEQVRQICNCLTVNQGVSGQTSTQICNRIRAYDFSNADAVFLEGGVNDFIVSSTMGSIQPIGSTFNTNTVYGAWQSAIEYIMTNYPQVKIFIDTPAPAWEGTDYLPANLANAKKEIAALYGIPCLDLYALSGITTLNRDYFYCDDVDDTTWRLHFNDYGNVLIGQMVAGFIDTH